MNTFDNADTNHFSSNTRSCSPNPPHSIVEGGELGAGYRPSFWIDYMAFGFRSCGDPTRLASELQDRLGDDWRVTERGRHGYEYGMRCGNVSIASDAKRGVYVEVTGQGCRELEGGRVPDLSCFIGEMLERGARFSRLDLAFDDHDGKLDIDAMVECAERGWYTAHSMGWHLPDRHKGGKAERISRGINFGEGSSNTFIRIYDKAMQMGLSGHHVRVELQMRKQRAQALAETLVRTGPEGAAGILYNALDFKVESGDIHKERWKTQDWWKEFIGYAGKARLATAPAPSSLDRTYQWLLRDVSRSLARIYDSPGGDQLVHKLIEEGRKRNQDGVRGDRSSGDPGK